MENNEIDKNKIDKEEKEAEEKIEKQIVEEKKFEEEIKIAEEKRTEKEEKLKDAEDKYGLGISFPAKMEEINKKVEFKEGLYKIGAYFNRVEKDEQGIYKLAIGKNGKMYLFPKDEASASKETMIVYKSAYEMENPGRGIIFIYQPALVTPDKNDPNELILEKKGILTII